MDRQSECTIQTLEDMIRACVIDFSGNWDVHLPLAEFSYNNSYHSSIRCAPFEALYGRKFRSLVLWAEIGESSLIRPELVQETTDKVVLIKEKLKAAMGHQKNYADNRRKPLEYEVGDRVLLKILERIGHVAYRLRLPEELSSVHDTFHVSNLKKCLADANLHVPLDESKIDKTLRFVEEPVEIMDRKEIWEDALSICSLYGRHCVVMISILVTPRVSALASAIKGLVGATTDVHRLSHTTDHPGGKPALISDRSSNISPQPYNAPSQLLHLLLEPGDPLLYSTEGRWRWLRVICEDMLKDALLELKR
ncbi:putative reverse transcriptase domain-containing protein [Tanacetum coccineum]|uniref:Reverse transcriptase domain-containing protein n=1 Tax=Tanacetum coccineum TaxID=301880 RepID=A0ABQ5ITD2_9ASTR